MTYEESLNYMESMDVEALIIIGIIMLVFMAMLFVIWLLTLYPRYYMVKASNIGPTWSAFIPIWQDIQLFKMAGWPWWSYWAYILGFSVLSCIPILNIFAAIGVMVFFGILYWRISTNFGLGTCGKILSLFFGLWVFWYVAITKKPYLGIYHQQCNPNNPTMYGNQPQQNNIGYQQPEQQNWNQNNNP